VDHGKEQVAKLDIQEIIEELKNETRRIDQAISALQGVGFGPSTTKSHTKGKFSTSTSGISNELSADERRAKRSEAMKKSWAARRKNS
jgi:hypothetical protein